MRYLAVINQLDHLGVDHDHADLVGASSHEHAQDDRIEADRFAGARSPGDEQMRHFRQVVNERPAFGIFAKEQWELGLGHFLANRLDHLFQADRCSIFVGYLNADRILARNRRDDAHTGNLQIERQIVGQPGHLVNPQAGFQGHLILSDDGAGVDADDANV